MNQVEGADPCMKYFHRHDEDHDEGQCDGCYAWCEGIGNPSGKPMGPRDACRAAAYQAIVVQHAEAFEALSGQGRIRWPPLHSADRTILWNPGRVNAVKQAIKPHMVQVTSAPSVNGNWDHNAAIVRKLLEVGHIDDVHSGGTGQGTPLGREHMT